jgi:hypothetical protein
MSLTDLERGVVQVLLSHGIIEDSELSRYVKLMANDLRGPSSDSSVESMFRRINLKLTTLAMEIRTVVQATKVTTTENPETEEGMDTDANAPNNPNNSSSSSSSRVQSTGVNIIKYHGIVNLEEDYCSKEFGSQLSKIECKLFSCMLPILVARMLPDTESRVVKEGMSIAEIEDLPRKGALAKEFADLQGSNKLNAGKMMQVLEEEAWVRRHEDTGYYILGLRSHLELKGHLEAIMKDQFDADTPQAEIDTQLSRCLRQVVLY